ncbi:MAG TPA: ABC transporter permease [Acidimicrobiales bacterium]
MRYIRQKVVQLAAVLLLVTFLTFLLLNLLPGGPETAALGIGADEQAQAEFREEQNLDDPLIVRYVDWLGGLLSGDLGDSLIANVPVTDLLSQRLPVTLQLMVYATFLALIIAVPLGILTAYKADSMFDKSANTIAFGLLSLPNFIVGVLLVFLFSIRLGWLPATGSTPFGEDPAEHVRRMILPTIALAVGQIAVYMRLLRTDMISTLQEDFIGVARAKGMPTRRILLRHALRPSSFSLLTVVAINVGQLIGGTIVIERIFAIPGLGSLLVESIFRRDYLVVQGCIVIVAVGFVLVNFIVDVLYAVLDPRIRHARAIA